MKRMLFPLLAVLFISLLCGCARTHPDNAAAPVTNGFTCQASIHYHELELQGQLSRQTDGKLLMAFTAPKSLTGITLGWDGNHMTMELGGMGVAVPTEKVPQGALIQRLLQVLCAPHTNGTVTDEGYVVTGEIDGQPYTFVCDPDTGLPRSLSLPEEELEAVFSQASLLTK